MSLFSSVAKILVGGLAEKSKRVIDYVVGNFVETDTRVYNLVMDKLHFAEDIFKVMENKIVEEPDTLFCNNSPQKINIKNTFNNLEINGYNMCKVVGDMDMFRGEKNPEVYLNNKVNFVGYAKLINGGPAYFMVVDCSLEQCYFDKINDLADKSEKYSV